MLGIHQPYFNNLKPGRSVFPYNRLFLTQLSAISAFQIIKCKIEFSSSKISKRRKFMWQLNINRALNCQSKTFTLYLYVYRIDNTILHMYGDCLSVDAKFSNNIFFFLSMRITSIVKASLLPLLVYIIWNFHVVDLCAIL